MYLGLSGVNCASYRERSVLKYEHNMLLYYQQRSLPLAGFYALATDDGLFNDGTSDAGKSLKRVCSCPLHMIVKHNMWGISTI